MNETEFLKIPVTAYYYITGTILALITIYAKTKDFFKWLISSYQKSKFRDSEQIEKVSKNISIIEQFADTQIRKWNTANWEDGGDAPVYAAVVGGNGRLLGEYEMYYTIEQEGG